MKFMAAPWLPDQPDFGNAGLTIAENVIPGADHYLSFPSAMTLGLEGMSGQAQGLTVALAPTGTPVLFSASGGSIYRIPGLTTPPVNVSRDSEYALPYAMLPNDRWRWVQYGALQLATQISEPLQSFDLNNLANSFGDVTNAPKARYIARIRDFTMLGYVDEAPDGLVPYRLRWHGFNTATGLPDITEWTISLETRSDFQDVSDLGEMTGLTGGEFGISLFRRGIARIDFGGQFLFEPRVVDDNLGCEVPGSVVQYGAATYFWNEEGIFRTRGGPAEPVGSERVNRYLRSNLDIGRLEDVWAFPDYGRGLIVWLLPISGSSRLLVYRPAVDRFSTIGVDLDSLGPTMSFGLDLDDPTEFPDLDTDPRNLDDPALWIGGALRLGGQIESVGPLVDEIEQWAATPAPGDVSADWATYMAAEFDSVDSIEPGSIALSPDGTPALRAQFSIGANHGFSDICEQLVALPSAQRESVTLRYEVYLDPAIDYEAVADTGGSETLAYFTFPGLVGGELWPGPNDHAYPAGNEPVDDGWSARIRVAGSGAIAPYLYVQNKPADFGWHRVSEHALRINHLRGFWSVWEQTCTMNTPGVADGRCVLRINGQTIVDVSDLEYRPLSAPGWVCNGIRLQSQVTGASGSGALIEFDVWMKNFELFFTVDDDYAELADLAAFDGVPLPGTLEWGELEPGDGQRFLVNRAQVYHTGGAAQVSILSRETMAGPGGAHVMNGPYSPQSDGMFRFKAEGRYHKLRVLLSGAWQTARGADVRGAPLGGR